MFILRGMRRQQTLHSRDYKLPIFTYVYHAYIYSYCHFVLYCMSARPQWKEMKVIRGLVSGKYLGLYNSKVLRFAKHHFVKLKVESGKR